MRFLDQDLDADQVESFSPSGLDRHDRRRFLSAALGSALIAGSIVARKTSVLADDDEDNSGPGGGDEGDNSGHGSDEDDDNSGHSGGDDGEDNGDDHGGPPSESEQLVGVTAVEIIDERFVPNNIRVETGTTVTWTNRDDDDHSASGRGMDTGVLSPGESGTVTFVEAGEFEYTCNFHSEMLGLVSVFGDSKATPVVEATPLPNDVVINIVDFGFESDLVRLAVGGTVKWVNSGATPHTVQGVFGDSGILDPGATYIWTFEVVGNYDYQCSLHSGMYGLVSVQEQIPATPVAATPVSAPSAVTVDIVDFGFEPPEVVVATGGTVTWTNRGGTPHTATADRFDSDIIEFGASFAWTFSEPGTFDYQCELHGGMHGTVKVI